MKTGICQIRLTNFRSYESLRLDMGEGMEPVVLTGHNGAGKTNVLEAISFLAPGRGLRSARLSDVALRSAEELCLPSGAEIGDEESDEAPICVRRLDDKVISLPARWSVSAKVQTATGEVSVGTGTIDGSQRRQVRIDGKNVTKQEALGEVLRCLWLTPAQDRLFCGDPVSRRRFLDRLVQAFDPAHSVRIGEYNTALKQWSYLLREGRYDNAWLSALEGQMAMTGVAIAASRLDIVMRISEHLGVNHLGNFPAPEIQLTGYIEQELLRSSAVMVEEHFAFHLQKTRKSYAEGGSVSGPHTADFKVFHKAKKMDAGLCSTGEQKALLVSIILAEMRAQMTEQGRCPLLLLDECAAHLDSRRRNELFDILAELPTQVWMTGTDDLSFTHLQNRARFITLEESNIVLKQVA